MFELTDIPEIDPRVVFNDEFDDWTILFQPLTGEVVGLDPAGVITWKLIDGKRSGEDIAAFHLARYDNLCALVRAVPAYLLHVSLKGAFWGEVARVLKPTV